MRRAPWIRILVSLPGAAAAIVALIGLADGPRTHGSGRHDALQAIAAKPPPKPRGPAPLAAGPAREVGVPNRLKGNGPFLTVRGRTAQLIRARRRHGVVALTFDDGPGPLTPAFLHRLERLHAKATFFLVGYAVKARPEYVRREVEAGMGVGNHSYAHAAMRPLRGADQRFQISAAEDLIARAAGFRPLFFRPPYLSFNLLTAREIAAAGMVGALWTIDTRDWTRPGVKAIVQRALQVKPGGVIGMHDFGGDRSETLAALGPIVRGLRKRGLEPVTLDQLYRRPPPPPVERP